MKNNRRILAALCIATIILSGCASDKQSEASHYSDEAKGSLTLESVSLIMEVFGDGQKPTAAALQYSTDVDSSYLSIEDFQVEDQTITNVYTNSEAAKSSEGNTGRFVILEFDYESSSDSDAYSNGGQNGGQGGRQNGGQDDRQGGVSKSSSISVTQVGDVIGIDGTTCSGSDAVEDSTSVINLAVDDFLQFEYADPETGYTIPYNLYLPENYDESKSYPLMFFVADASVNSDEVTAPLTQGLGAVIWATPEEQAKRECIVLAPQYTTNLSDSIGSLTEDDHQWSDGLTLVTNLLLDVIEQYSVDESRIYGTGQSQGCMTNIAISDKYPDLFAAQLLVAGQWDTEEMSAIKDKHLWIVVCEGDNKAYPGMTEATANWASLGTSIATSEMWDSTSSVEEFDDLVAAMEAQECNINFTVFSDGDHNYTWTVAYTIEGIRDWLFTQ